MNNHLVIDSWFGGLCNNITQLCHAIYIAEQTKSYLEILPHSEFLKTHDFDFTDGVQNRKKIFSNFFHVDYTAFGVCPLNWNERRRLIKNYIRPMMSMKIFPDEHDSGLVIHIRSGDIFKRKSLRRVLVEAESPLIGLARLVKGTHRVHPSFVQPPLSFYQKILDNSSSWPRVTLIAEDLENPVITSLLEQYKYIRFKKGSLESDIRALLSAQNLVIGYGTFGITCALLSDHLQYLYSPILPAKIFGKLVPGDFENITIEAFEFANYIPLGQWKANSSQKLLMLNYDSRNITAHAEVKTDISANLKD